MAEAEVALARMETLEAKLHDLTEVIKNGLNAGNGDGEWEALVVAGDLLGLEYNEEEDKYE